ncbi:Metallo-dependent phosphatase, partial [Atractiella rhizophila]
LDATYSSYFPPADLTFSRVGAVTQHGAKISYRLPEGVKGRLRWRETRPEGPWNLVKGEVEGLEERDWTGTVAVEGLSAGRTYEYRIVLPSPSADDPTIPHPLAASLPVQTFHTLPDSSLAASGSHFTFASSSCIRPGFPYTLWPWRNPRGMPGMRYLKEAIDRDQLEFLLFLGDFIYSDTSISPADQSETYARSYRNTFASPDFRSVYESVPTLFMYDDHEFKNNYAGQGNDSDPIWQAASTAYDDYLGKGNYDSASKDVNYYSFKRGDVAFFVWDTRRYRSSNLLPDGPEKTMLGDKQKKVFYNWLALNHTATFKFIVSSVPFNTLWAGKDGQITWLTVMNRHLDTWAGFQTERTEIMDILEHVPNVIVLSGDRHEFAATSIRNKVYEFSTSPLNQFYFPLIRTYSNSHGLGPTGEDKNIKYIPVGNYKFSTFEVDTRNSSEPTLKVAVNIDGNVAWRCATPIVRRYMSNVSVGLH